MSKEIVNISEQMARDAQKYKEQEKIGEGRAITTRAGVFKIGAGDDAQEVPGNKLLAIVLDAVWANVYYDTKFDADNVQPPRCYAYGRSEDEMFPHLESMKEDMSYFMPQHFVNGEVKGCVGCPMAEWGSAERGRGKACSNRRKLALLPAGLYEKPGRDWEGQLYDAPSHFQHADIYTLNLPVTSVRNWSKMVQWLSATHNRPPYGAIVEISIRPDAKTQFAIEFEFVELVDQALLPIIYPRHADAVSRGLLIEGYRAPSEEDDRPQRGGGGFKRRAR